MTLRLAGLAALSAAASALGLVAVAVPVAADAAERAAPRDLSCRTGPARRVLAGQPWVFHSCSDGTTLIGHAGEGNPDAPFLFFLIRDKDRYVFAPFPSGMPDRASAARAVLLAMSAEEIAGLIDETQGQPAVEIASRPPAPAGAYEEERIGEWRLRTDRKARTFGIIWMDTGVIELAARSADGKAEIVVRDNGARLAAFLGTPACAAVSHVAAYDGEAKSGVTLADFARDAAGACAGNAYVTEIRSWLRDFPAAARAMQARALAVYGPDTKRCVAPPFRPDVSPPHHPPCGFPPPEIGENHRE